MLFEFRLKGGNMEIDKNTSILKNKRKSGYIGVLDLGTTSVRFIIFKRDGKIVSENYLPIKQYYPRSGWVEEDPMEIWESSQEVIRRSVLKCMINFNEIAAVGISSQRESTVVWDKNSGKPCSSLIVWQDRRTSKRCDELKDQGLLEFIRGKTGLIIDPYFSATKLEWILSDNNEIREKAKRGEVLFGTLDTWIIFKLTGRHLTDVSNASRTMLFNIYDLKWDDELLSIFNVPKNILPEVLPSYGKSIFGFTKADSVFNNKIPICSDFGDQQASLFGQRCFQEGDIKGTFGTGTFVLVNTGANKVVSKNLLTTIYYGSDKNEISYALEGSVYNTGSIFQWLKEEMGIINDYDDIDKLASEVGYQGNMFIVPAFTGLGAPFWDPYARGIIVGLTRASGRNHIVRAAMEAIAYRTKDVLITMQKDSGAVFREIKIDGGVSQNKLFCKILADLTGIKIKKFDIKEVTALGAMYGAGIGSGFWDNPLQITEDRDFEYYLPEIDDEFREYLYKNWSRAILCSREWINEDLCK
jgi:glycerol kinase